MICLIRSAVLAFFCLACERSASTISRGDSTSSSTQSASSSRPVPPIPDPTEAFIYTELPDSSTGAWNFEPPGNPEAGSHYIGKYARRRSGLLTLWIDTATRATEERPVGTAHVDSLVVRGLKHGEFLATFCNSYGQRDSRVVGILDDTVQAARPRLAWLFDPATLRIKTIATDSVSCGPGEQYDDVD